MRPGLKVGWNVDRLNIKAGVDRAATLGYDSSEFQLVAEYALMRHARGEEDGAEKTALSHGIDLTSWKIILANAIVSAEEE